MHKTEVAGLLFVAGIVRTYKISFEPLSIWQVTFYLKAAAVYVDNEPMITDLIKALLNRAGNIDIAHNGQEALKFIENKFYKLIISDIDMPVMDGFNFYKEVVRKFPELKDKFLFITGDSSNVKQVFFKENQVKYLSKPIKINLLRAEASKIILSN